MNKEKEYGNKKIALVSKLVSLESEEKKCLRRKCKRILGGEYLRMSWPAVLIMLAGVSMMIYGIFRGEMTVVYSKAIQICLECIGIG